MFENMYVIAVTFALMLFVMIVGILVASKGNDDDQWLTVVEGLDGEPERLNFVGTAMEFDDYLMELHSKGTKIYNNFVNMSTLQSGSFVWEEVCGFQVGAKSH